jgi:hypothetical protein
MVRAKLLRTKQFSWRGERMVDSAVSQEIYIQTVLGGKGFRMLSREVGHETSDRSQSNPTKFASKSREFLSTPLSASAKDMSPLKGHGSGSNSNTAVAKAANVLCHK